MKGHIEHRVTIACAFWVIAVQLSAAFAAEITAGKPNVVIILADDMGVECLSSYGGKGLIESRIIG